MEKLFLIMTINNTIDLISTIPTTIITIKNDNGLALIWYHDENTDSLWQMFSSINQRNEYFRFLEDEFYVECNKKLYVKYNFGPTEFNDKLCTSIILEW